MMKLSKINVIALTLFIVLIFTGCGAYGPVIKTIDEEYVIGNTIENIIDKYGQPDAIVSQDSLKILTTNQLKNEEIFIVSYIVERDLFGDPIWCDITVKDGKAISVTN